MWVMTYVNLTLSSQCTWLTCVQHMPQDNHVKQDHSSRYCKEDGCHPGHVKTLHKAMTAPPNYNCWVYKQGHCILQVYADSLKPAFKNKALLQLWVKIVVTSNRHNHMLCYNSINLIFFLLSSCFAFTSFHTLTNENNMKRITMCTINKLFDYNNRQWRWQTMGGRGDPTPQRQGYGDPTPYFKATERHTNPRFSR